MVWRRCGEPTRRSPPFNLDPYLDDRRPVPRQGLTKNKLAFDFLLHYRFDFWGACFLPTYTSV